MEESSYIRRNATDNVFEVEVEENDDETDTVVNIGDDTFKFSRKRDLSSSNRKRTLFEMLAKDDQVVSDVAERSFSRSYIDFTKEVMYDASEENEANVLEGQRLITNTLTREKNVKKIFQTGRHFYKVGHFDQTETRRLYEREKIERDRQRELDFNKLFYHDRYIETTYPMRLVEFDERLRTSPFMYLPKFFMDIFVNHRLCILVYSLWKPVCLLNPEERPLWTLHHVRSEAKMIGLYEDENFARPYNEYYLMRFRYEAPVTGKSDSRDVVTHPNREVETSNNKAEGPSLPQNDSFNEEKLQNADESYISSLIQGMVVCNVLLKPIAEDESNLEESAKPPKLFCFVLFFFTLS